MSLDVAAVRYRYLFQHEVDGSDAEHLIDALEDEDFPIREALGEAAMVAAIRAGLLSFEAEGPAQLDWFGAALTVLSVYLSEYIMGLELAEGRNAEGGRVAVEIRKYVARRGELIAVPLTHKILFPSGDIEPGLEDLRYLREHWSELPRWAQDGYRLKFPELRVLD